MVLKRDKFVDISLGRNEETMDGLGLSCSGFYLSGKTFDCFEEAVHVPSLRRRGSAHRFRLGAVVEPHVAERHDPDFGSESFVGQRSEEHKSELQSLMRISYDVFCLQIKKHNTNNIT